MYIEVYVTPKFQHRSTPGAIYIYICILLELSYTLYAPVPICLTTSSLILSDFCVKCIRESRFPPWVKHGSRPRSSVPAGHRPPCWSACWLRAFRAICPGPLLLVEYVDVIHTTTLFDTSCWVDVHTLLHDFGCYRLEYWIPVLIFIVQELRNK